MDNKKVTYLSFVPIIISLVISHNLPFLNEGWCVVTTFICYKNDFIESVGKGSMRFIGTVVGGVGATILIKTIDYNSFMLSIIILTVATICLYFNNITRHGYGWLYLTITFFTMSKTYLVTPDMDVFTYLIVRILSVLVGVIIAIAIRFLINPEDNHKRFNKVLNSFSRKNFFSGYNNKFNPDIFLYSLEAGISLFIISYIQFKDHANLVFYTTLSVIFLSSIPYNKILASNRKAFVRKMIFMIIGTFIGTIMGVFLIYVMHGSKSMYYILLSLGIVFSSYLQLHEKTDYLGVQIGILFILLLVPEPQEYLSIAKAFSRGEGILIATVTILLSMVIVNAIKFIFIMQFKDKKMF